MFQSLEVAGISFDLIIIRIWTGVSTEQTQAFAAADVAPHSMKPEIERKWRTASVHSALTELDALELQVVVSPEEPMGWRVKSVDHI